jgi:hypothetical protein
VVSCWTRLNSVLLGEDTVVSCWTRLNSVLLGEDTVALSTAALPVNTERNLASSRAHMQPETWVT